MTFRIEMGNPVQRVPPLPNCRLQGFEGHDVLAGQRLGREAELPQQLEDQAGQGLVLPAGADGNRLGLMADGVDGPGQLVNGMTEGDVEKIEGRGEFLLPFEIHPEVFEGQLPHGVFQQQDDIGGGPDADLGKRPSSSRSWNAGKAPTSRRTGGQRGDRKGNRPACPVRSWPGSSGCGTPAGMSPLRLCSGPHSTPRGDRRRY